MDCSRTLLCVPNKSPNLLCSSGDTAISLSNSDRNRISLVNLIRKYAGFFAVLVGVSGSGWAQKTVHCPDGDHIQIDLRQIAIQYDASSFAGTLSSLKILSSRLEVVPKQLQETADAPQQWKEFVKGFGKRIQRLRRDAPAACRWTSRVRGPREIRNNLHFITADCVPCLSMSSIKRDVKKKNSASTGRGDFFWRSSPL